jgi:3',5'-cyclic AMP phosphodiesterase CpdA
MEKKILLRFRDTSSIDTIAEHIHIVNKNGYVWWGWWKKDSEPQREGLFKELKNEISKFSFYLFDRSTNRFYYLKIEDIYFQMNEKVHSPERENTPSYYEDSILPLWIKVIKIIEISESSFLKNFNLVPSALGYTFFTEEDIFEEWEIINSINQRIKLRSDYILHLSDIHFGVDYGFPFKNSPNKRPLLDIIVDHITNDLKIEIGLLIVSGDITSRGVADHLFNEGVTFLNGICEKLNIEKKAVIIVPGNHDIALADANFIDYSHERMYRLFLKEFYQEEKELFGLEYFEFPSGKTVDILRIHSVKLRKKEESNYGYVDWYHFKTFLTANKLDGNLKIAVIHHHLVSTPSEEILDPQYPFGSISVTIDSGRVIQGLQKHGFQIVLNGHQHMPGITKIMRGIVNDNNEMIISDNQFITILSAGSAGVKENRFCEEVKYNTFSLYKVNYDSLEVEVKVYNPSSEPKRHYNSIILFK